MENVKRWGAGIVGVLIFVGSKLSWVLALLKLVKIPSLISMFIMLGTYALIFGWRFAVAIVYLIFIHEMGHLVAAKWKGIQTSPAIFIPFVGAAISIKEDQIKDAKTEAFIAYGGPLAGLISFLPAIPLYYGTGDPIWGLMIYLGAFLNLFNLIPISPLDGGRIITAFSTKVWLVGLIILVILAIKFSNPLMYFILIIGGITWYNRMTEGRKIELLRHEKSLYEKAIENIYSWADRMKNHEGYSFDYVHYSLQSDYNWLGTEVERLEKQRDNLPFWKRKEINRMEAEIHSVRDQRMLLHSFLAELRDRNMDTQEDNQEQYWHSMDEKVSKSIEKDFNVQEVEEKLQRLKTYYQTDTKTKMIWISLYIILLAVLGGFMWLGEGIMNSLTGYPSID